MLTSVLEYVRSDMMLDDFSADEDAGEDMESLFGPDPASPSANPETDSRPRRQPTSAPRELSPEDGAPARRLPGRGSRLPGLGFPFSSQLASSSVP